MITDRPALGVIFMLGFCIIAPLGDAMAKIISETIPVGQLLLVRFGIQAAILIPIIWLTNRRWRMNYRILGLTITRTILHIIGIGCMFTSLYYLPLADAIAIAFVMPFISLLLGKFALSEEVGRRRLIACTIGFLGTLMVIQPSFITVGWHALWPLGVAVSFALFMLITRKIAKETDPVSLQAVSGSVACLILIPPIVFSHSNDIELLSLVMPSVAHLWLLGLVGVLGTFAHLLITWSLRLAPSTTLAPMQYLEIPIATLLGWLIFGELPNCIASLGIMITILAGTYIIFREQAIVRQSVSNYKH
ncbi:MAG: DMT family transporter [Aestuariivita sp.]|nr:DMT family transporter [Aestuariivita sp.]